MSQTRLTLTLWVFSSLSWASTITKSPADDPTFGPFKFVNNSGVVVYDLETIWTGTGGTLSNGVITQNDGPGAATITASSNMVTVTWNDGGLKVGGAVEFKMDSEFGAVFNAGGWSDINGNIIASASPVPEPSGVLTAGLALMLFGIALLRGSVQTLTRMHGLKNKGVYNESQVPLCWCSDFNR